MKQWLEDLLIEAIENGDIQTIMETYKKMKEKGLTIEVVEE